jgi:hypothetical protein
MDPAGREERVESQQGPRPETTWTLLTLGERSKPLPAGSPLQGTAIYRWLEFLAGRLVRSGSGQSPRMQAYNGVSRGTDRVLYVLSFSVRSD